MTPGFLFAQEGVVRVGLFNDNIVYSVVIRTGPLQHQMVADDSLQFFLSPNSLLYVTTIEDRILVRDKNKFLGVFNGVEFLSDANDSYIGIKPIAPVIELREYGGNIIVKSSHGALSFINEISADQYIAAVVRAEGGSEAHFEYYKTQSILCRTFLLANLDRHREEGFQVCDGTHCQVYHGRTNWSQHIYEVVLETAGLVVTDNRGNIISAAFHSNSGGETVNSEEIWVKREPYLVSKKDPWSLKGKHAFWQKEITLDEWKDYLIMNGIRLNGISDNTLIFRQPYRRQFYNIGDQSLSLEQIRADFHLNSAFFDIYLQGDNLIFRGSGYGHGVGLSQEGAMVMANEGYWYPEIIKFYFPGVLISDFGEETIKLD